MKTTIYFLIFGIFFSFSAFGQQWTTSSTGIYSTGNKVLIGTNDVQGLFGIDDSLLQLVSPSNSMSFLSMSAGTKGITFGTGIYGNAMYISANDSFSFAYGANKVMSINPNMSVSIGTNLNPTGYKLAVGGKIIAEELKVQLQSAPWPDYVFASDYQLPSLLEVEKQIQENGHLENIPSACEVQENGIEVGEMNRLLLEKVEELTLYTIEQQKQLDQQTKEIEELKALVKELVQNK
ncbi:hypothetical protein GOQ30_16555 [Flavobacterium sp. TP390]|uniref:Peptidase S74 domain-containing protein n=1 Tax=Flavobacterium profundi TaxID=1774945 RepID=A0A6I4IV59_9FLAO|nr:hypothetical protein [Flavobacterium profundi]MVO10784.1 hypothetical protein [Flavobacterium profundi]